MSDVNPPIALNLALNVTPTPDVETYKQAMLEKAQELFSLCDKESKGVITKSDLQHLQSELPLTEEQLNIVFDSLDDNGRGYLTMKKFTEGFGSFVGISLPSTPGSPVNRRFVDNEFNGTDLARKSEIYESPDIDDYSEKRLQEILEHLGVHNLLQDDVSVLRALWSRLQTDEPQLLTFFEEFLSRVTSELHRTHNDYEQLATVMRNKTVGHDEEIHRLYDEMETQILMEKEKILTEEKARELRLRQKMANELADKERHIQEMMAKQTEMEEQLRQLNLRQSETKHENDRLQKDRDQLENLIQQYRQNLAESKNHINKHREKQMDEKRERAIATLNHNEGIAKEHESLLKQLKMLRDMNRRLLDERDDSEGRSSGYEILDEDDDQLVNGHRAPNGAALLKGLNVQRRNSLKRAKRPPSPGSKRLHLTKKKMTAEKDFKLKAADGEEATKQSLADMAGTVNDVPMGVPERIFKVVCVGDSGVGKTSFMHRFCTNEFDTSYSATIGVDFHMKSIMVNGHHVALQLWDTAGQERFRSITKQYFRKADGVLIVYDLTSEESFRSVRNWMTSVKEKTEEGTVFVIVANKLDIIDSNRREVAAKDGTKLAKEYGALFYEASAKTGECVTDSMQAMTSLLKEREDKMVQRAALRLSDSPKILPSSSSCCLTS